MNYIFIKTRIALEKQVKSMKLRKPLEKIYLTVLKKVNFVELYNKWVINGRNDGEFQELLYEAINSMIIKLYPNITDDIELITDELIVKTIPLD